MSERKGLTVGELIAVLGTFDPSLPAWIDGCDCADRATAAVLEDDGTVMITREDSEYRYPIGSLVRDGRESREAGA